MRRRDFNDESISSKNFARFLFLVIYLCIRILLLLFLSGQHYICISNDSYLRRHSHIGLGAANHSHVCSVWTHSDEGLYGHIDRAIPTKEKEVGDKWIKARDTILNSSNWRAIFWLMQKFFVGIISLICAVLLYVTPLVFIVTPLLFDILIYLLGIAMNSWTKAIFVMIVGGIFIWIRICIGNCLVRIIGMYTRTMFKAIKGW